MIDGGVRPTSYTLHFLIRCLAKGQDYKGLERVLHIWRHYKLVDHTRMEYWHLKSMLNIIIDDKRSDLVMHFLDTVHSLKLLDYDSDHHSTKMQHKDKGIQIEILRKLCLYGTQTVDQINEWMRFVTTHWKLNRVQIPGGDNEGVDGKCIPNRIMAEVLLWNEIDSVDGPHGIKALLTQLGIQNVDEMVMDHVIIKVLLGNMKRKSHQQFAAVHDYKYSIVDGLELFRFASKQFPDCFVPNIACYNQLFGMIKSGEEMKIAKQLLEEMKRNRIRPDTQTAIHLIRLLYHNPSHFHLNHNGDDDDNDNGDDGGFVLQQKSGHQVLNELIRMGLECNPIHQDIYHELVRLHAFYADFTSFLLTLYKMKAENEVPAQFSVTKIDSDDVDHDDEEEEEREMVQRSKSPRKVVIDERTFEPIIEPILISKLAASGQVDNCCLILDEMIECGYRPAGPVYRDMIDQMGKNGYPQQALQMIDRALLDGILFSDRIWRFWMLSFAKRGQIESCLLFLDKMDRSNNIRLISTRHFNGLLYAYYQNGDVEGMEKTYQYMIAVTQCKHREDGEYKMNKMKIKPDIKSYHIIARAYLEGNESGKLHDLLESMEYHDIPLDWKMYSIALQDMLRERDDVCWQNVDEFLSTVIAAKQCFPRQPMVDDVLSAAMQLDALPQGLQFIHQSFDDPDLRTSTLPSEGKLGEFIATMFVNTAQSRDYEQLYRGMLGYLTERYQNIYSILNTKMAKKSKSSPDDAVQSKLREQKAFLGNFRFRPRRLLQHALLALERHFDPITCCIETGNGDDVEDEGERGYERKLNHRQLLVDILRHLFVPIDEMKADKMRMNQNKSKKSKEKQENEKEALSGYTDEQLLSAYYPMIEEVLHQSVKEHPHLVLMSSSELSIPIKSGLFTKMIHSLVFNGNVSTIEAIAPIVDDYYNSNAANPYIAYFQYEPEERTADDGEDKIDGCSSTSNGRMQAIKPWLISSKSEWTFLPFQMIDCSELQRVGMRISDLILFDAFLYDERLDDALKHLGSLHKERKISYIVIKQIVQRTLSYLEQTEQLQINDKEYVSKVTATLSAVLNQMPTTNDEIDWSESKKKGSAERERKRRDRNETKELFEWIWNEAGFVRGAIVLQGLCIKLDDGHCLRPHLHKFCVSEFAKLQQYGLLESDADEKSTMLLDDRSRHTQTPSLLAI